MNPISNKNTIKFIFLILLTLFLCSMNVVFAETSDENDSSTITGEEKAVFAFFKLGKKSPDYERWIKSTPLYIATNEAKQIQLLIQESMRLDAGFGAYNLEEDPLVISLDINAQITSPNKEGKSFFMSEFSGIDMSNGQLPSFDFPYVDEKIILVVFELTQLQTMPLSLEQVKAMSEKTDELDSYFPAHLTLFIRPSEADHETPVISDSGKIQWLMSGKIAYMRCSYDDLRTGEDDKQIWEYIAPWYQSTFDKKNAPKVEEYPDPFEILKKKK